MWVCVGVGVYVYGWTKFLAHIEPYKFIFNEEENEKDKYNNT